MTVIYLDKRNIILAVAALTGTFVIGILIGTLGISSTTTNNNSNNNHPVNNARNGKSTSDNLEELFSEILQSVESDNIRSYLKTITSAPHIAASEQDSFLTKWISDKWKEFGFDHVNLEQYNLLLSYPDPENPNKIYLKDDQSRVQFTSKHKEDVLRAEDQHPDFIHAFNAFSPAGNVTGDLVYVNYARVEDISRLEELGVNLTGKIAIARYGKVYRGDKVKHCQEAGAIGVILYTDPEQVAPNGTDPDSVYPNTIFLPPSGIQRGNVLTSKGDPLSPTWSSVPGAYRLSVNEAVRNYFPKIPCQPIGYGDAEQLLTIMGGDLERAAQMVLTRSAVNGEAVYHIGTHMSHVHDRVNPSLSLRATLLAYL